MFCPVHFTQTYHSEFRNENFPCNYLGTIERLSVLYSIQMNPLFKPQNFYNIVSLANVQDDHDTLH